MFSLAASGTLGKAITFSSWKGRPYVRERVIPANPKSGDQVGRRAMFAFLTQEWGSQGAGTKATWKDLADQLIVSNFNAFISLNMEGWHNFLTPGKLPTQPRVNNASDNALTSADWEQNRVKLTIAGSGLEYGWGLAIFATPGALITPSVGNCVKVVPDLTIAEHFEYWTPPDKIQYSFDTIAFSVDGKQETKGGDQQAEV